MRIRKNLALGVRFPPAAHTFMLAKLYRKLSDKLSKPQKDESQIWRNVATLWGLVFFIIILIDFVQENAIAHSKLLLPISTIYIVVLTIYAGEKEFERWYEVYQGRHPGELFVFAWTGLMIFLILGALLWQRHEYELPEPVTAAYLAVLGVLIITRRSKALHEERKEMRKHRSN